MCMSCPLGVVRRALDFFLLSFFFFSHLPGTYLVEDRLRQRLDIVQRRKLGIDAGAVDIIQTAVVVAVVGGRVDPEIPNVYMSLVGAVCDGGSKLNLVAWRGHQQSSVRKGGVLDDVHGGDQSLPDLTYQG